MECELHGAVELEPQGARLRFTRRIRLQIPAPMPSTLCHREIITLPEAEKRRSIWEMWAQIGLGGEDIVLLYGVVAEDITSRDVLI